MKRGVLISFSGIDGAGKSTQVRLLSDYLRKKGKKVYSTEEMFGYFLLKPLVRVLRAATGSPSEGPVKKNRHLFPKLWFIPAFIDIWLGYIFRVRPLLKKYDFVLADRFYWDIWANLAYYGYLPNWGFRVFLKLLPKPDKALMLSVRPKIGQKRASEFPLAYFEEQAKIYKRLMGYVDFYFGRNKLVYIVDTNQNSKRVFEEIRKLF